MWLYGGALTGAVIWGTPIAAVDRNAPFDTNITSRVFSFSQFYVNYSTSNFYL